jgi:tRNA 2-thiouridine synthesizing protein A
MSGYPQHWDFDEVFDSYGQGCGDFIIELRGILRELSPGTVLMIAAADAGAPVEIPAWCRLTGHALLDAAPPYYLVRRREDV